MDIKQCEDFFPSDHHSFCVFMLENQEMADLHGHEFDELVIVRKGSGFHIVNDHVEMIRCGDFFFVTANDVHYYESTSELALVNILIHRQRDFKYIKKIDELIDVIRSNTHAFSDRYRPLGEDALDDVIYLAESISQRRDDMFDQYYFSSIEASFLQILTLLCQRITRPTAADTQESGKFFLLDKVRQNYAQNINWKGACEEGGMAIRTLYRFFHEATGKTPEKFQQIYRLLKAQELLRTTDNPVSRIAASCGFINPPRFVEAYRRHFQRTPSQERKLSISVKQR